GALLFFALALWGTFIALRGVGRWLLAPSRPAARAKSNDDAIVPEERDGATDQDGSHIVAQCLPIPTATPARHVRELLPDYCRALMRAPGKVIPDESEQAASSTH